MLRPLNKRLVATLCDPIEKKTGVLIIPGKEARKETYRVVSVSENEQGIEVGDRILVEKYDALEKEIEGEKVFLILCERVLGIVESK